jgi:ribosome assembly protein 1
MGKVYPVLGRRRAKIVDEQVREESGLVQISALLPVIESFGFAEELRKQTSGAAHSQLIFNNSNATASTSSSSSDGTDSSSGPRGGGGWEILDKDPFFVALTEEELEDIGSNLGGVAPNIARQYVDQIRRRKGLPVEEQIVKHAEKQRTLSKKK